MAALDQMTLPQFQVPNVSSLNLPRMGDAPAPMPQPMPQQAQPQPQAQQSYPGLKRPPPAVGTTVNGMTYMGGDPRSKDPSVWRPAQGDTFLNSLPLDENQKTLVKGIANYDLPPGSQRGGLGSPEVQQLLGMAKQYDPDFSASDYVNRQQTRQAFLKGDYSKSVTALSTAIDHAAALAQAGKKLNNTGSPAWNAVANWTAQNIGGDPRPGNYNQIAQMEGGEVTKAITNGNGGEGDRIQATGNYPVNGSPAQQDQAIGTTVGLLKSKLDELNATYQRGMGKTHSVMDLLSPSARKSWQSLTQNIGASGPDGAAPAPAGAGPTPQQIADELRRRGVIK